MKLHLRETVIRYTACRNTHIWRIMSPYVDGDDYRINGYRFFLPADMSVEELLTAIRHDFTEYIMPALCGVTCQKDFEELRGRIKPEAAKMNKDMKVLRIMHSAVISRAMEPEQTELAKLHQAYGLRKEEVLSHEKELQLICDNQGVLYEEIYTILEQALI